ncbi:hypothetical protein DFP72DRAFT_1071731 [Ephemerocybe angulata]|uniref:Uncharacterized protein n=1 Tax=Ephemerocybe angulata TaxID=980116 RepID=A0A8H6HR45_9AGAR|nr:hypothetical protein DFP72DRAFT_1071731 [Tulosesus angulatus]
MATPKLSPQARRLKTIIVALPILVASSYVFYKREIVKEVPRRTIPKPENVTPSATLESKVFPPDVDSESKRPSST